MALLLGIDVGTTNWKAALFDEAGHQVALAKTSTVTHFDEEGRASYDFRELWHKVARTVAAALEQAGRTTEIAAVAVSSVAETVVPVDEAGEPLAHAIAWFDTRSLPQSQELEKALGRERIFAITGLDNNPIFSVAKIMWYRQHAPEVFARTRKWLGVADYVNWKLTGVFATDHTHASRTMALDLDKCDWSQEILDAAGLSANGFPDIYPSGTVIGRVTEAAAAETGLMAGTPVVMGGHDHLCGSLAAGVLLGDSVLDSSGTAEAIVGISQPGAAVPKKFGGFRVGRYLDPSRYATWGGVISSGASVDWAMDRFASLAAWHPAGGGLDGPSPAERDRGKVCLSLKYDEAMAEAEKTPPGARGLLFLPHLRGCGAPYWEPRSRGALIGLRSTHTQPELMRAVIEGLCFEVRQIVDLMESVAGCKIRKLHTVGGGAHSAFWQQVKADVTGRTVEVPRVEEATLAGAALLAGIGIGIYRDMLDASLRTYEAKTQFEPRPEAQELYAGLYDLYKQVYPALLRLNTTLHEFAGN